MKKGIKSSLFYLIGGIIFLSIVLNIYKQAGILWEARKRNEETRLEITKLEKENRQIGQQIKYATSSAFVNRQARESFGLGTPDDYWLILPEEEGAMDLFPEVNIGDNKPKYQQWLDLFR